MVTSIRGFVFHLISTPLNGRIKGANINKVSHGSVAIQKKLFCSAPTERNTNKMKALLDALKTAIPLSCRAVQKMYVPQHPSPAYTMSTPYTLVPSSRSLPPPPYYYYDQTYMSPHYASPLPPPPRPAAPILGCCEGTPLCCGFVLGMCFAIFCCADEIGAPDPCCCCF